MYRRYARCWWHLTLHIINVEKNVSRLLFIFFFLFCVCIPWVWLGWRWCGCVLMHCSLFRNFTFCFDWFYFILACLHICVLLVFSFRCLFQCLFVCLFISFVFPFCIYLLLMLCDCTLSFFLWKYIRSNTKREYKRNK